ncbi:MAG: beta-N-acetylhexosaminidase [Gammaproteobacteria bacterium]|nr:beta-N-acetylhexosaminidase [Gammaproteobacteria bacterium]
MSLGPIMLDLDSTEMSPEEREILQNPLVGGVILFTRNFSSVEQLIQLVKDIHQIRKPRLLVAVDHEGGRVQRFRDGFTSLPAVGHFGEIYKHNRKRAHLLSETAGWIMAAELRAVGIDFSFAPVLDIDYGVSEVIGDRAFHQDPNIITELAHAYTKGMHDAGMACTGKHFPGHGAVTADSHIEIPVDDREYKEIYAQDILPFKRMIKHGMAAVMPAHVIYSKVDNLPAGFSEVWLKDILRQRLGFQGVIFSDDLDMKGASVIGSKYIDRAEKALSAGCDMVLVCNNREGALNVLDNLSGHNDPVAHIRLARMHGKHETTMNELHATRMWKKSSDILKRYQDDPTLDLEF